MRPSGITTLRVSEIYGSTQGEGPMTGYPTIFLRFAGCNLRCPGWPCDTEHAINPAIWRKESTKHTTDALVEIVAEQANSMGIKNICWTGGEPFMQKNVELEKLFYGLRDLGFGQECFTNGTYEFPEWAYDLPMMMDWKLAGSGEGDVKIDNRLANINNFTEKDGVKFVIKTEQDLAEAKSLTDWFIKLKIKPRLWVGAAWEQIKEADLVAFILENKMPWSLNVQTHKYIWDPDERAV